MAFQKFSDIYGGNWSYSLYGDQQGLVITERGHKKNGTKFKHSNSDINGIRMADKHVLKTSDRKVKNDNDQIKLSLRVYPEVSYTSQKPAREDVDNTDSDLEEISADTPRPGTGQVLLRHVRFKSQEKNFQNGSASEWDRVENTSATEYQGLENFQSDSKAVTPNTDHAGKPSDADHVGDIGERRPNGRSGAEIEEFRRRLKEKAALQNKMRQNEHALQRELLWKWVVEKSKGQDLNTLKGVNSLENSDRITSLEDIAEDNETTTNQGSVKRSCSSDSNYFNEEPPPLPPRHTRGNSLTSLGTDVRRKHAANRRRNRSSLPLGLQMGDSTDNQMVSPRSPAVRKRDAMHRRYNSTSALLGCTVSSLAADDCDYDGPSRDVLLLRRTSSRTDESSTDDGLRNGSSGGSCPASPADVFGDTASYFSAQHYDGDVEDHLDKVDIVGESFDARYPWQRDVSTQCNIAHLFRTSTSSSRTSCTSCGSEDSLDTPTPSVRSSKSPVTSPEIVLRRKANAFRQKRPHSIGCVDNVIYEAEMEKLREINSRRVRHSEPLIQSAAGCYPESVSDLESILENPKEGTVDSSRNNSIISEDGVSADELSSLLKNPQNGRTYLDVLPSPRVSPEMWSNVPDVIVNAEDDRAYVKEHRNSSSGSQYLEVPCKNATEAAVLRPSLKKCMFAVLLPIICENATEAAVLRPSLKKCMFAVLLPIICENATEAAVLRPSLKKCMFAVLLPIICELPRRKSSGSITSGSEDSDVEPSPPVVRRGRRAAIVDTKNFGDVSPTTLSPEVSPSNSCDEGEGASNIAGRLRRRRSSVDLAMSIYPGDLLVQEHHKKLIKRNTISDFYAGRNGSTPSLNEDNKKARQPFSLLKLMKTRSKESLSHLGDILTKMKPSEFKDNHLAAYKSVHWTDLIASTDKQTSVTDGLNISEMERKRRETVWELFKSECVFLIDHLMVLKHCFLEPLKKVQVEGFLMYAEPSDIFSNLDELCYVSYTFCKDFIAGLVKDMSATDFGRTSVLIKAFQRFSTHSKDGEVYHSYCLNYTNALNYLETLRKNDDFCEFEKWCEQDSRCNRLQLADLLISPMQHCTKLPLLLYNIKKYTENPTEKQHIADSIQKVEASLQQLEDKMKWLKNFERVQEIQRHLVWPQVTDLDPRAFIPEYLKSKLLQQPCERLLACPRRQLIHEGAITLTESTKTHDAYLFLFDDVLLITKIKKPNRKKQTGSDLNHSKQTSSSQPDRQTYIVHRQPIALDRFGLHDVSSSEAAANGLKYAFVLVQISRFQQIIDVFTLQAPTELVKSSWMVQIREAKRKYNSANLSRDSSIKEEEIVDNNNRESFCKEKLLQQQQQQQQPQQQSLDSPQIPSSVRRRSGSSVKRIQHAKSLSVDAIFL